MQTELLWQGSTDFIQNSHLFQFRNWLAQNQGLDFKDYRELWQWSVDDPSGFWKCIWDYFEISAREQPKSVLTGDTMPEFSWFSGATLNYSEHIFKRSTSEYPAIIFENENGAYRELSWEELETKVAALANYFKEIGVEPGDRIAAFMPNVPEATIAFLAANAIGAVWSSTSPDFGADSVVDRFAQIQPKVFIGTDGYWYNQKAYAKREVVLSIVDALDSVEDVILFPYLDPEALSRFPEHFKDLNQILEGSSPPLSFTAVDFSHPIWILYSSGTTGLPKPIVHSHGGILLEHYKYLAFHNDVHPGERFFWFSTTGWMMWNFVQSALLMGATIVLYDGSPNRPDLNRLWSFSEKVGIHHFGTSAPYLVACMKQELHPDAQFDLSALRSIGSTGAPLPHEAFKYVYHHIKKDVWLCSMAGGTDVCTAFVGGNPFYAVHAGEIQCRALGVALHAYDSSGNRVVNELGEMVIEKPMPSMPIYFWNDPKGDRYRASYFEHYPGKWRHGDFIKINANTDGLIIYGRSDATLNRHGIRIGTSEIYRAVNKVDGVEDGLIVNLELESGQHFMPLFVKMKSGFSLNEDIKSAIKNQLRSDYSPRHVPDTIIEVPDIPYTLSGKKMETPVKKILMGLPLEGAINIDSMRNPNAVDFFIAYRKEMQ